MRVDFRWNTYKYLPYEHSLASRELSSLMGTAPIPIPGGLSIEGQGDWQECAYRTTYFREAISANGNRVIPLQTILEASANGILQSELPDIETAPALSRQSTRYSAHGFHEYRGKFNPQVVRAIGNILGLRANGWLLDPFCGSGTSLLEALHCGWNALGLDINPLAVLIARAKLAVMKIPTAILRAHTETVKQRLLRRFDNKQFDKAFTSYEIQVLGGKDWQARLPNPDYLCAWFTESVLVQLSTILDEISRLPSEDIRLVLQILLSDILRHVSLQDPADLRIRRRKSPPVNAPAVPMFLDNMSGRLETIFKAREHLPESNTVQDTMLADVKDCVSYVQPHPFFGTACGFDAAITSPPYATALPYIDTQRLSLVLLGLVDAGSIRPAERSLIGNREISPQERLKIEQCLNANSDRLPDECWSLCCDLRQALNEGSDGFRRQNVPALIYKYLVDMARMFEQVRQLLKPGAPFALVVGPNRTWLGGQSFVIDTPHLLSLLAESKGFRAHESVGLDTYQRYDVHQANSIRSETLIVLRRVDQ
jgi:SAM-dependent methyltransferase